MATTGNGGEDGRVPRDAPAVDFAQYRARRVRLRLLELLDALVVAMERRDLQTVWDVLDEEDAVRGFPAGVRAEALAIARLSRSSLRAPLHAYRFYHQLEQLGDEPLDLSDDPRQLALDLAPPGTARPVIAFPERPTAPPDDPHRGGGADRRRSGWR
jgi:hypothetical protein